jgi:cytochrome c
MNTDDLLECRGAQLSTRSYATLGRGEIATREASPGADHRRAITTRVVSLFAEAIMLFAVPVGFAQERTAVNNLVPLRAPDEKTLPGGPVGTAIRYGKVLTETQSYAKANVGSGLNCSSCHLDAGRKAYASPWVGRWGVFPEYRSRNGQVNALQDRVNDCFERSMNGKPLPYDSNEMRGILAYIWWLSKGRSETGVDAGSRAFR